jgi:hypothetical protein
VSNGDDPKTINWRMKMREQETPEDVFDDVMSLCAKLLHDVETNGKVAMDDLVNLRDDINSIRTLVAGGSGYQAFSKISKEPL